MTSAVETPPDATSSDTALTNDSPMDAEAPVPVWVHRLHGDGLPSERTGPAPADSTGSQEFVKRWKDATAGY